MTAARAAQDKMDLTHQLQRKESALLECQRCLADTKRRAEDVADASSTSVIEMKDRYRDLHAQHLACGEALDDARTQLQQQLQRHESVCQQHTELLTAAKSREQTLLQQVQSMEESKESDDEKLSLVHQEERERLKTIETAHNTMTSEVFTMTQQIASLQSEMLQMRQCHEEELNTRKLELNNLTGHLLSLQGTYDQREEENKASRSVQEDMEHQHAQAITALQTTQRNTGMISVENLFFTQY